MLGAHNVVFAVRLAAEPLAENMRLHRIVHPAAPVGHLDQQLLVTVRNVEFYRRVDRGVECRLHGVIQQVTNNGHQLRFTQRGRHAGELAGGIKQQLDAFFARADVFS